MWVMGLKFSHTANEANYVNAEVITISSFKFAVHHAQ